FGVCVLCFCVCWFFCCVLFFWLWGCCVVVVCGLGGGFIGFCWWLSWVWGWGVWCVFALCLGFWWLVWLLCVWCCWWVVLVCGVFGRFVLVVVGCVLVLGFGGCVVVFVVVWVLGLVFLGFGLCVVVLGLVVVGVGCLVGLLCVVWLFLWVGGLFCFGCCSGCWGWGVGFGGFFWVCLVVFLCCFGLFLFVLVWVFGCGVGGVY
ncbi:hypothetical protein RA265_27620, partial [Pseudomonas syringae pv. tagetis]|uniref:hypothetical protein n=1 Tax=Pseudomonas syringae group genomosp. 7 TaxID=251699 RepID=UPI00376F9756